MRKKKPLPRGHRSLKVGVINPRQGWFNVGANSITPGSVWPHAVDIIYYRSARELTLAILWSGFLRKNSRHHADLRGFPGRSPPRGPEWGGF